jgi:hypothetical protein
MNKLRQEYKIWYKRSRLQKLHHLYTFKEWLDLSPYTEKEKEELVRLWDDFIPESFTFEGQGNPDRIHEVMKILSFNKAETYPEIKFFRSINGRYDLAKIVFGPIIKSIEKAVYEDEHFIKHVSWPNRCQWFTDKFSRFSKFYGTDYSSFEASFTRPLVMAVEYQLYESLLGQQLAKVLIDAFYSQNTSTFAGVTMKFEAKRASGDPQTSLGNGFTNLIAIRAYLRSEGIDPDGPLVDYVVEGDDGFIGTNLPLGDDLSFFKNCGLKVEFTRFKDFNVGSFCGMIFDLSTHTIMADPIKVLLNYGWASADYIDSTTTCRMSLLRAKALSFAYLYPRCPLISTFTRRMLQLTRKVRVRKNHLLAVSGWKYQLLPRDEESLTGILGDPTPEARELFAEIFGFSVLEQFELEKYFANLEVGEWSHPLFDAHLKPLYFEMFEKYFTEERTREQTMPEPDFSVMCSLVNHAIDNDLSFDRLFDPNFWRMAHGRSQDELINAMAG